MTDSAARPPREFWILHNKAFPDGYIVPDEYKQGIHVIVYEEYQSLLAERDALKECEFAWEQQRRKLEHFENGHWHKDYVAACQRADLAEKERDQLLAQAEALAGAVDKLSTKVVTGMREAEQGGFRSVPLRHSDFVELADALAAWRKFRGGGE